MKPTRWCFRLAVAAVLAVTFASAQARAQQAVENTATWPAPQEGDFIVRDFHFQSGETMPEVRIHYTTLGKPVKDATGRTTNAVLVLHGTGGNGHSLLRPIFAGVLFGPGQLLDATRYFIILPDNLGTWKIQQA